MRCQPIRFAEMHNRLVEILRGLAGDSILALEEFRTGPEGYAEVPQGVWEGGVVGARVADEVDGGAEEEDGLVQGFELAVFFGVEEEVAGFADVDVDAFGEFFDDGVG